MAKKNRNNTDNNTSKSNSKDKQNIKNTDTPKSHRTRNAYFIFLGILAFAILIFMMYCYKSLTLYEEAQPYYVMDEVIANLKTAGFSSANTDGLYFTQFDTEEAFLAEKNALIQNNEFSYYKLRENYSDGALIYAIYAGETKIAEASLLPQSSYNRMYLLTITDWAFGSYTLMQSNGGYSVDATIPEDYTLYINGVEIDSAFQTASRENPSLVYCKEYVTIPPIVSYHVDGLANPANVEIVNGSKTEYVCEDSSLEPADTILDNTTGPDIHITNENEKALTIAIDYAAPDVVPEDIKEMVFENVERYSNFFSRDIEGCLESVDGIRDLFPEESIYLTLADQYRREDMRVFSSHTNTHFLNEEISEYTIYSSDCFSCRVHFDKSMTLGGSREMIDTTDNVYYYVKIDNRWVIADIQ